MGFAHYSQLLLAVNGHDGLYGTCKTPEKFWAKWVEEDIQKPATKGNLILNPHLVKAPKECIDYVILHELCHISEYNHSERFWRLLTQVMPNWKEVKARLDGMAEFYLNE